MARSDGVNRAISAFQLATNEAGRTSSEGFAAPSFLSADNSPRTWIVLPSPMSSAKHAPRPRPDRNRSQPTPVSWYLRKVPFRPRPNWSGWRPSGLRSLASTSPSHWPAWTKDHARSSRSPSVSSPRSAGAPARSRIPSTKERPPRHCSSTWRQWSRASWSLSRSTSTHCPRRSTSPSSEAISSRHSASVSSWSPRARWSWKSSIAPTWNFACFWSPILMPARGRGRFFHQSGRRTRTPLSSRTGTSFKNR